MNESDRDAINKAVTAGQLSTEASEYLLTWLSQPDYADFSSELQGLIGTEKWSELDDAFYTRIRVGTGGIRGPLGVGPNRINTRTIGEAAQALSNFIQGFGEEAVAKGVVVGHEVRKGSRDFAEMCCEVFAANGIKSYIFDHYRSTPELSFAVRHLGVVAGVQLTASHNPRTDNGFKFYWTDGGQVVPPLDLKFMSLVTAVSGITRMPYQEAVAAGLITEVGADVDTAYIAAVLQQGVTDAHSATITFSPIHGAGSTNVQPVLEQAGFSINVVPEQAQPDETFPTAAGDLLNPEFAEVMRMPVELAEKNGTDLAVMSDPDADRIGVAVKASFHENAMRRLSGNEVGIALTQHILSKLKERNELFPDSLVIDTYVTTSLIPKIARSFSITAVDDLLVGFKFIGELVTKLENPDRFVFAAEESLGYLRGNYARDKDAAVAGLLVAGLASELKEKEQTIGDYLDTIYEEHGYFKNLLLPAVLGQGRVGKQRIIEAMLGLRASPPTELAGMKVLEVLDLLPESQRAKETYSAAATGDQLTFILSDDHLRRVTARPSGTEPIIKFYIQHWSPVEGTLAATKQTIDAQADELQAAIDTYARSFIVS
jgi:phosphoglucomutase